ncbi:ras association domain-containing protein 5-like [Toxotes jaculatrix]|uniref:ras association domain-containing protein 5-like n=1 Tax=Toxotes jaculatrix TaxID=941984 RepID=UPI001B3A8749|nr:ras association domain-containing protein 5-like [Toxotes jaculatrix]
MFNVMHQGRKYVPTRSWVTDDPPLTVLAVHVNKSPWTLSDAPEATWPPQGSKMRISKASKGAVVVRAVRRYPSPQPASLESLEAAWSERWHSEVKPPESLPSPERRNGAGEAAGSGMEGHGGGPQRSRKKGFRPPDVRTIFSPEERDPRVKVECGEGHSFELGGEDTWCDACCGYIFQHGLTCAGCKYSCHAACRDRVSLDCHPAASPISQDQLNNNTQLHPLIH